MDLRSAGLTKQPFPSHGKPQALVTYRSQQAGMEMLRETCQHPTGLSLLQGPPLSGKSTLIRTFVEALPEDCEVAVIDGRGLNATNLMISVLKHFGYDPELSSANELLGLLRVFVQQQAAMHESPLLIIENAHDLNPSALRTLSELAELRVRFGSALKLVLVSEYSLTSTISGSAMEAVAKRVLHDFHLRPMTENEARDYLSHKLRAAGSDSPERIFPDDVCQELWEASDGWPGVLDRVALLALAKSDSLPVAACAVERPALPRGTWDSVADIMLDDADGESRAPRLVLMNNGTVLNEMTMNEPRVLIGRSEHNDISINSRFISRHHALLVRHGVTTFLMDLNSTNGTFVNSKRASNQVLMDDDFITVGHHLIRFLDNRATTRADLDDEQFSQTSIMKTMDDMRDLLERENTALLPSLSEELPTIQT